VIVAVLAGGRGTRMGGEKAMALFRGEPIVLRPLAAAREAGLEAVVVAKPETQLPDVPVWHETETVSHPLAGLVAALERGPCVAVACDQPYVTPELLRALADHDGPAIAAEGEPFPGRYEPSQLPVLRESLRAEASLRRTLARLAPAVLGAPRELCASVNTPEALAAAQQAPGGAAAQAGGEAARGGGPVGATTAAPARGLSPHAGAGGAAAPEGPS